MEIINQSSLERERENKMNNSLQVDWTPVSINWRHWMVDWLVTIFNVWCSNVWTGRFKYTIIYDVYENKIQQIGKKLPKWWSRCLLIIHTHALIHQGYIYTIIQQTGDIEVMKENLLKKVLKFLFLNLNSIKILQMWMIFVWMFMIKTSLDWFNLSFLNWLIAIWLWWKQKKMKIFTLMIVYWKHGIYK